jgi:hypothetical protein
MLADTHVPLLCSEAKLSFNLLSPLLALKLLPEPLHLFTHAFFALLTLPLLIHGPTLHDSRHNLRSIDVLELVICDLAVDVEGLGNGVGVVGQGHEFGDAVVDGYWGRVGEGEEEGLGEGEGRAKDDGVDILRCVRIWTLHCDL